MTATTKRDTVIETIARVHLGIETLDSRGRDALDFHDVSVWQIKAALEAAYLAGAKYADERAVRA